MNKKKINNHSCCDEKNENHKGSSLIVDKKESNKMSHCSSEDAHSHNHSKSSTPSCHEHLEGFTKKFWIKFFIFVTPFIFFITINILQPKGDISWAWHPGIWAPITAYIVLWEGRSYFRIYKNVFKKQFGMDTLVGLSSHILFLFSIVNTIINWNQPMYSYEVFWEAPVMLIIVMNIGHNLEHKVLTENANELKGVNLDKENIVVIRNGKEISMPASNIKVNDQIIVRKGDLILFDGNALGVATIDNSNITGESKHIKVNKGDKVVSGSYNVGSQFLMVVKEIASKSTYSTLFKKLNDLKNYRPKLQIIAEKITTWFVITLLSLFIITFITYITLGYTIGINLPWINNQESTIYLAIKAAVATLAIACPTALAISLPLTYLITSLILLKGKIVINNSEQLSNFSRVKYILFDKTGTITEDVLVVKEIEGDQKYISIAKGLEKNIDHPIAKSISNLDGKVAKIKNIKQKDNEITGKFNNKIYTIGTFKENDKPYTAIALYENKNLKVVFYLENKIKDNVKETIKYLKKKYKVLMVTGDNSIIANDIAKRIGIDKVYSEVSPNEKFKIVKRLKKNGGVVFVGDGFNDALAIKSSDISIAFASGSELTNSIADVSILDNNFTSLINLVKISKWNNKELKASFGWIIILNMISIPLAMLLFIQPWIAALIMTLSDIVLASNAIMYKKIGTGIIKKTNKKYNRKIQST